MPKTSKEAAEINAAVIALMARIQAYCQSQVDVLHTVPGLALEADGRPEFIDTLGRAYGDGLWTLEMCKDQNGYTAFLSLSTGELVNARDTSRPADVRDILLLACAIEDLNANTIVERLRELIHRPDGTDGQWRLKLRRAAEMLPHDSLGRMTIYG